MTSKKQLQLDELKTSILKDNVCPELAKNATQLVFGEGNINSEILFIGEAPGKQEDLKGLPFVGAAGKFLDEMLTIINLKRQDIYITNIVKYRPPANRDPLPEEKQAFLPYLLKQIEIIDPLLIITLGRHSMECFLPNQQISKIHGQPKRRKSRVFLPLFHPAAALYNGSMRSILIDDFKTIPQVINLIKQDNN